MNQWLRREEGKYGLGLASQDKNCAAKIEIVYQIVKAFFPRLEFRPKLLLSSVHESFDAVP